MMLEMQYRLQEEERHQQSYPVVNPASYDNDLADKVPSRAIVSGITIVGANNHFPVVFEICFTGGNSCLVL